MVELKESLSRQQASSGYNSGSTNQPRNENAEDLRFVSTPSDMDDTLQNDSLSEPVFERVKSAGYDMDYDNVSDEDSLKNDEIEQLNKLVSSLCLIY